MHLLPTPCVTCQKCGCAFVSDTAAVVASDKISLVVYHRHDFELLIQWACRARWCTNAGALNHAAVRNGTGVPLRQTALAENGPFDCLRSKRHDKRRDRVAFHEVSSGIYKFDYFKFEV